MEPRIAQDIADFRKLRENGCVYVDKTAILHELVCDPTRSLYFISRPRRFGKSLMLSTLECIFRGQRDLFKGLAIDKLDYDWAEYPVLHFNFAGLKVETFEAFKIDFRSRVKETLDKVGYTWNDADFPGANFSRAINTLAMASKQKSVVVLIDEYDAPVSHALGDIKLATAIRQELSDFYIQIKNNAANIRFMMMTGVTKFTQLSVFSALNNLNNLTLDDRYATLLGYTDDELTNYFEPAMRRHAEVMGLSYEDYREQLRWWYNGYRFARWNTTKVYNPCAIGKTLGTCTPEFLGTWTSTGLTSAVFHYFANNQLVIKITRTSRMSSRMTWTSVSWRISSPPPCFIRAVTSPSKTTATAPSPLASPMRRSDAHSTPSSSRSLSDRKTIVISALSVGP